MTWGWEKIVVAGILAGVGYAVGEKIVDALWARVFGGAAK